MPIYYGVLRGKVDRFKREDDLSSPHLQIRIIDGANQKWRAAVNILSADNSFLIFHRADPLQGHTIVNGLDQIASGFTVLPKEIRTTSNSLDFLRAPLFDLTAGIAIPSVGPGANDDLQDMMTTYLNQLMAQNGEIFVFGAKWPEPGKKDNPQPIDKDFDTHQGIHDTHMNQGNPTTGKNAKYSKDNGTFQDGGIILKYPSRVVGLFFRFQTELLPTDDNTGHPLPGAVVIPPVGPTTPTDPGTPPPVVTYPPVYIERALVNPGGDDVGHEVVVLGNTTVSPINLAGWAIADKNNKKEKITNLILQAGESGLVKLSGQTAQLGNNGGTIRLLDASDNQVHAVTYAKEDAQVDKRYIRFNN